MVRLSGGGGIEIRFMILFRGCKRVRLDESQVTSFALDQAIFLTGVRKFTSEYVCSSEAAPSPDTRSPNEGTGGTGATEGAGITGLGTGSR